MELLIIAVVILLFILAIGRKFRLRGRRNRRRYGPLRVNRKGYRWQRVTIHLPFLRALEWKRNRR